jgi:hypothetical protein
MLGGKIHGKMMWGKKHISIEDVISEKQIKFSSNLQDEAAEKCQIQSIWRDRTNHWDAQVATVVHLTISEAMHWSRAEVRP